MEIQALAVVARDVVSPLAEPEELYSHRQQSPYHRRVHRRLHADRHRHRERPEKGRSTRAATARPERLWDYGVIPYEIESNFSGKYSFAHLAVFARENVNM